jgi:replicative DNA helicase
VTPGLVLIDHLGLVQPVRRTDSRAADTAATVDQLKDIAKAIGCPVVALAQVNRGPESRTDKRPTMGDLNWSGSIEQIADLVCLLFRQAYYDARSTDPDEQDRAHARRHDLELLVAKNRAGPIGTQKAWVDVACNAIRDAPTEASSQSYQGRRG